MKKIIFVTVSMGGGGLERVVSLLANYFVNNNFEVSIMMMVGNTVSYDIDSRIELISIGEASKGKLIERIKRIIRMRRIFRQNSKCTIIAMSSVASIFSIIATRGLNNQLIISERNHPDILNGKPYTKIMRMIRDFLYSMSTVCVLQTNDAKAYFNKKIADKSIVIPNPIADGILPAYEGKRENAIVTAGRLVPVKNHAMLLNAFAIFHKTFPDYILKIYGDGPLEEDLKKMARELGIDLYVKFIPFTARLHEEIMASKIFVSTSNSEGFSNAILEAMALGIPTVATDCPIGGTKMCIENNVNGILVPVGDVMQLVKGMECIASDEEFAEQLSLNAQKVREIFSQEIIMRQWMSIVCQGITEE